MKRLGDDWEKDLNGPMAALARKFVNEDQVRAMKNYQAPPKSSEDTETDTETSQQQVSLHCVWRIVTFKFVIARLSF